MDLANRNLLDTATLARIAPSMLLDVINALPQQIAVIDSNCDVVFVNSAWRHFSSDNGGDADKSWVGANYCDHVGDADLAERIRAVAQGRADRFRIEYPCDSPAKARWFLMETSPLANGGAVVTHLDISDRKKIEQEAGRAALEDRLTKLLNRRGLEDAFESISLAGDAYALFIDCDDFKRINDTFGHAVGDVVLRATADQLKAVLRNTDIICRLGGDEFLVLLPEASRNHAYLVAERIRALFEARPIAESQQPITMTLSIALTQVVANMLSVDDLVRTAASALQVAKRNGKNRVFAQDSIAPELTRVSIVNMLGSADGFDALVQPVIDLKTNGAVAYEFLSRSRREECIGPQDFFRIAEAAGALTRVDIACLMAGVRAASGLPNEIVRHYNLFPSTLMTVAPERIAYILSAAGPLTSICIELSEQQLIGDPSPLNARLAPLRQRGVRFAIDDVGFGRSSVENLIELEPEVIKIDRRVVDGIATNDALKQSFDRVASLAHALGALCIAEGVEREADGAVLLDCGVHLAQGYFYGRPTGEKWWKH